MTMEVEYEFEFVVTAPIEVEESFANRAILKGVILKLNKITTNGREYLIEEGPRIAKELIGKAVKFGSDALTGRHMKSSLYEVGIVRDVICDVANKVITGIIEVMNTAKYPDLVQRIKPGWGLSIQGQAHGFQLLGGRAPNGLPKMKILGMIPNGVQLLMPETRRGQDEAQVGEVFPVEESYQFDPCPWGQCEIEETEVITGDVPPELVEPIEPIEPVIPVEPVVIEKPVIKIRRKIYKTEDPDTSLRWARRSGSQ